MSKYTPHTPEDISSMLADIGISDVDQLFADIPQKLRAKKLNIPDGISQYAVEQKFAALARKNKCYDIILRGYGAYDHVIPAAVKSIISRSEFLTAYTPYQPEISQGVLQAIFEYQTMVCNISGLDVSNASVYDVATACAEAINMCTEKSKKVLVSSSVNDDTRKVIDTYAFASGNNIEVIPLSNGITDVKALNKLLEGNDIACVVVQNPNQFGLIEDMESIGNIIHSNNSKFIYVYEPISASLLLSPAQCGADIAAGEGQPLGLPLSYGGPYLGMLSATKAMSRKLVGRIVGKTVDAEGKDCFVLTMQAREQHIRREKASSSICSNQALCALASVVYTSVLGKHGIVEVANQCVSKSHYFADKLTKIKGIKLKYNGEFFCEFVTEQNNTDKILQILDKNAILGGHKLSDNQILWCVTEKITKQQLDEVISLVAEVSV